MDDAKKEKVRNIFGKVPIFVTPHAIKEFTKDVNTLPKNPAAAIERLLRGGRIIPRSQHDRQKDVLRFRNGVFDFIVALDSSSQQCKIIVVTCWQRRRIKKTRVRNRDSRAQEKQLLQKKIDKALYST